MRREAEGSLRMKKREMWIVGIREQLKEEEEEEEVEVDASEAHGHRRDGFRSGPSPLSRKDTASFH